ncbi:MAG: sensor histidine kinase [Clostridia bacterium]|nr:sensor histidine kinase [Clostridia bacterium]
MNRQLLGLILSMFMSFAFMNIVYEALFAYSLKRRRHFALRVVLTLLGVGAVSVGASFALYGFFESGIEANVVSIDLLRGASYVGFVIIGIIALVVCFDEKPSLLLFTAVAANASLTISSALYSILIDVTGCGSIFFTMYNGVDPWGFVIYYAVHIVVLVLSWLLFARPFAKMDKNFGKDINKFILGLYVLYALFTAAISESQFFNLTLMNITTDTSPYSLAIPMIFNIFTIVFAGFVLFVQRFNLVWVKDVQEQEAAQSFHQHYKDRVDKQQANMELVNQKLDDIKQQVAKIILKYKLDKAILDELNTVSVDIFDSSIQTGNDALDVLFTQKSLSLGIKNIKLSAMLDGKALDFMDVSDVNAFFGNAIDNAVEYLEQVDEDKRFIRISSVRNRSLLMIRIENYCDKDLTFTKDGRPHSTKSGSQGYGTHSIKSVAEKYGGTAKFSREGDLFVVTALFSACEPF